MIAALSITPVAAMASSPLSFSAGPVTGSPPSTLGPYTMHSFSPDTTAGSASTLSLNGPTGEISFSHEVIHDIVPTTWGSWSNGYTGDVYFMSASPYEVSLTLPPGTQALYFYAEPDNNGPFNFTATARDKSAADTLGSGSISIAGASGAKYFGFYSTGEAIRTISVSTESGSGGFALGELGIATNQAPTAITGPSSGVTAGTAHLTGTVNATGINTSYRFEYGTTTAYGSNTATTSAGAGASNQSVAADLAGLQPGTTYHYRLAATGAFGAQSTGQDATFTTAAAPPPPEAKLSLSGPASASASGVTVTLACTGSPCTGKAVLTATELLKGKSVKGVSAKSTAKTTKLTVVVGSANVSLAAGGSEKLTVKLNGTGQKLLAKFKKLPLKLTVSSIATGGKSSVVGTAHATALAPAKKSSKGSKKKH